MIHQVELKLSAFQIRNRQGTKTVKQSRRPHIRAPPGLLTSGSSAPMGGVSRVPLESSIISLSRRALLQRCAVHGFRNQESRSPGVRTQTDSTTWAEHSVHPSLTVIRFYVQSRLAWHLQGVSFEQQRSYHYSSYNSKTWSE